MSSAIRQRLILAASIALALAYVWVRGGLAAATEQGGPPAARDAGSSASTEKATFAAGCFWCVEADFDKLSGVLATISGYTGGTLKNPTYEQVSRGGTGHTEAVEIVYDPAKITYDQLLDHFWKNVDPLTAHRQFCDVGDQYRPAIFFHNDAQRRAAEESKARVQRRFDQPVVVQILPAGPFYRAEAYHQDYYKRNPLQYRYYRWGCGRDQRLEALAKAQTSK